MKVLWIVNRMLPVIANHLGQESTVKEGWITGLYSQIMANTAGNGIELSIAFPAKDELSTYEGDIPVGDIALPNMRFGVSTEGLTFKAYGFYEDISKPHKYDIRTEESIKRVLREANPDIIHVFGTEYPHCLATLKVAENPNRVLLGLQGLCFVIADDYEADLPKRIVNRNTLRDFLKHDSIKNQKKKFGLRGANEVEALSLASFVTGRTLWDQEMVMSVNPKLTYINMNETLRSPFYTGQWHKENAEEGRIFVSQADYPLKGLHYVLDAMPSILRECTNAHIYVGGQNITKHETLKQKLKLSSYAKYLLKQIKKNNLCDKVTFLGNLSAEEMKEQYIKAEVYVCPSKLENSPNSLGEAMLIGTPCVAARVGGIPSIMAEDEGILYESGNVEELSEAIIKQLKSVPEVIGRIRKARGHAVCDHDADSNYHALLQIYDRVKRG